jgi:hypothetical protein
MNPALVNILKIGPLAREICPLEDAEQVLLEYLIHKIVCDLRIICEQEIPEDLADSNPLLEFQVAQASEVESKILIRFDEVRRA